MQPGSRLRFWSTDWCCASTQEKANKPKNTKQDREKQENKDKTNKTKNTKQDREKQENKDKTNKTKKLLTLIVQENLF